MADVHHTPGPWKQGRMSPLKIVAKNGRIIAELIDPRDVPLVLSAPLLLAEAQNVVAGLRSMAIRPSHYIGLSAAIAAAIRSTS